jgi:hypothetical protein
MGSFSRLAGRFLSISALGLWLAGFTVYTALVIPIGHRQISSGRFGFVTGEVTSVLNILAAIAALVLLVNLVAERDAAGGGLRWALVGTWLLILATLVVLVVLHVKIDGLLDYKAREISNQERFQSLHERYELVATVQWAAGLAHLWCVLASWRRIDRRTSSST